MDAALQKTCKSWNEPGHAHFVTISCYRRLPLVSRERTRRWVTDAMQRARAELDIALWAYVIMPEHVHLLLCPLRPRYTMRQILATLKRPVAAAAKAFLVERRQTAWLERLTVRYPTREVFRFWRPGGGFDHSVFCEKTVAAVVDYIHANPVRRGMVAQPTDGGGRAPDSGTAEATLHSGWTTPIPEPVTGSPRHCSQSSGTRNVAVEL